MQGLSRIAVFREFGTADELIINQRALVRLRDGDCVCRGLRNCLIFA
jgi:hypothetical protein